jgi:MFS family permease
VVGYIINLWHKEKKGTVMGIVLASNGVGGAIAIELAGSLIDPEVTGSYRAAYKMIAAVLAATLVLLVIFLRDKKPEAATEEKKTEQTSGLEFSELVRRPYFWAMLVCIFFSGFILQGTYGIVAMHYKDVGIDYGAVKAILSFGSLLLAGSKFLTGFIYDKFGLRFSASLCTFFAVASAVVLASVKGNSVGFVLAVIYTVISPLALPLETIMLPIYALDLCGKKAYARTLGIFVSVNTAGYALSTPVMNLCYDVLGSYVPALVTSAVIMSAVFILLQFTISAAHKDQKKLNTIQA